MNRRHLLLAGAALAAGAPLAGVAVAQGVPVAPVVPRIPLKTVQLGRARVDDYAWLRDPDYQKVLKDPAVLRPEIRAMLEAENAYSDAVLASTRPLQDQLIAEMRARIQPDDETAPVDDGPWSYFTRYAAGAEQPAYLRRPRGGGPEQVLLDANGMAKGKAFFAIETARHSPDHRLFAYSVDEAGSEYYRIVTLDLATGETLGEPAQNGEGGFVFSPDSQWLFWAGRDENGRPSSIFRRPARGGPDVLVQHEPDEGMSLEVAVSSDRQAILISSLNQQTSETSFIPASNPTAKPRLMQARLDGVQYRVDRWDGRFVILTNADGAIDYKIVQADEADLSKTGWRDLVPHRPGRYITAMAPTERHLARSERVDATDRIVILPKGGSETEVAFDEEAYSVTLEPGLEYASPVVRYLYQSYVTPPQWWDYDMATGKRSLRKQTTVPGHDPARYVTRRLWATAADGARIPISTLMKRDTPLDGSAPLQLFGYGSYGYSVLPVFSSSILCLADRGWICATAHIRGGSEKGWGWFLDGRAFRKKNTFTDYIACAEQLCATGYATPGGILAYGRSAGGMLMGAILNMRPDLWAGVLAGVPFVDVINTMSDTSLPLTPGEWPEWGNPLKDPKAYDYIASYSPYDNVRPNAFPVVLATAGLTDPRVTYWEPAKWIARLRTNNTGSNPMLLHVNMGAGHHGAAGRFDALKDAALNNAFAIWAMARRDDRKAPS